jgi:hypothetical protein
MKKIPKLLPISKARESINAIRRIPLENKFVQEFSKILGSVCHCFFWIS